jgi:hypothetical protein
MKKIILFLFLFISNQVFAQTNPIIIKWLQNRTGIKGRHYVSGNSTPIQDNDSANVMAVSYAATSVYVRTNGVPSYITGPFLDGNPSLTTAQNAIFKFPLTPAQNTGTLTATSGGNIGLFINGVALFDYRDGVAWNSTTNSLCGGPGNPPCPGGPGATNSWNRDAIVAERAGFDCAKGHPAMGNYHHHQNPSAFNLDLTVISNICSIYAADGLYTIDSTAHSPLIGFAYDGFPIYGAYAYKNVDGTGGIVRMKSSYSLRNITTRTTSPTGATVAAGPPVSTTYPLGYFREDYQYNPTSAATPDYLDEHNGRFCVTPEYPNGIYCYFATVDARWNSAYPYVVGPTFYGVRTAVKVTSITEAVTPYIQGSAVSPSVSALNCANATISATASVNILYSGTANVPYTGGNGAAYTAGSAISSIGVTGLTATLQTGTLANGNGNITYIITGTPTSSGTASFAISFGGKNCSISIPVNSTPPQQPQIGSLICTQALISGSAYAGTLYSGNATIPYTGGNGAIYPFAGPSISSTGVTGLTATLQPDTLNAGNGNLLFIITGTPSGSGTATFNLNFGGQNCVLPLYVTELPFDFIIQPNPVENQLLKVKFSNSLTIAEQVWIYDATGRLVIIQSFPDVDAGIPIGKLASGTYMVKIMDQRTKTMITKPMVISKH